MHTILVTGGRGFIGGCFVRQIIGETTHQRRQPRQTDLRGQSRFAGIGRAQSALHVRARRHCRRRTCLGPAARARRDARRQFCRRIARRPLDRRAGRVCADQRRGHVPRAGGGAELLARSAADRAATSFAFCTFRPTRSTARWARAACSPNRRRTRRIRPTRRRRRRRTISSAPITTPMACRR